VKFWGVRGSIACPGPEYKKYGGNTPCVEVRCNDRILIFDAGTGLRPLGNLMCLEGNTEADIFLVMLIWTTLADYHFLGQLLILKTL
jgi:phosphoribosyl 1,2-cyclic phosphodiesterase